MEEFRNGKGYVDDYKIMHIVYADLEKTSDRVVEKIYGRCSKNGQLRCLC